MNHQTPIAWLRRSAACASLLLVAFGLITASTARAQDDPFRRENLVAWCIVPFDSQKRTPAQRAEMLERLGIQRLAYDYRAEHIPSFDEELDELARHNIELTAWWFPPVLNDEAKLILRVLEKHGVKTQLWVTGSGQPTASAEEQRRRVKAEADRIRPIAEAAARQGCTVALYNHGHWFGEPENQLAIIDELKMKNVGIVYNLHHGHDQVTRFKELLDRMLPHLMAINLNGMVPGGEATGQKIVPLGAGSLDVQLLKTIRDSGFKGPIGILNHTNHDAEARLRDNLDGLAWLLPQLDGRPPAAAPAYRTWPEPPAPRPAKPDAAKPDAAKPDAAKPDAPKSEAPKSDAPQSGSSKPGAAEPDAPKPDGVQAGAASSSSAISDREVKRLAEEALAQGKPERGVAVFASARSACLTCHKIGSQGGSVGPELSLVGSQRTPVQLAESLLLPNRQVEDKYKAFHALTGDGRVVHGYRVSETSAELVLRDPSTAVETRLPKDELESIKPAPSVMPEGLAGSMSREQQLDLVAFLVELGQHKQLRREIIESVLEHAQPHEPASFAYERGPLNPAAWPNWQAPVNRDRLYDFYAKEAHAFRQAPRFERLLAEFPGLDGGQQGHWGNQNEASWASDEWNGTTLSSVQAGVFHAGKLVVPRAVCVQLGERGELAACFDPDTLSYRALWNGGFIKFSDVRHGFVHGLVADGNLIDLPPAAAGAKHLEGTEYQGFYRLGPRVVFAYRVGQTEYLDAPWVENGQFTRELAPRSEHSLAKQLHASAAQWPETITTEIALGSGKPYAIDTIGLPVQNPWKAAIYCGDHDFLPDGSALVCTMQGDVWHVSGFSAEASAKAWPRRATWRRVAAGLHHALGLKIDRDGIFVLGRDQITRLHDLNHDGEADFYECFSRAYQTSPAGHDFICGLERDAAGNFYVASGNQGLLRISPDGRTAKIIAAGFRNPDGLGLYPDGTVTVPCSEGNWTPASMICAVPPLGGGSDAGTSGPARAVDALPDADLDGVRFYGYRGKQYAQRPIARPELPLVYLPRGLDNSSGGQVFVDSTRWGPLAGQMIHFSFGTGSHFLLLRDEVDGQLQGAVVPLEGQFDSGAHRGAFSPLDGQLYVSGMGGWGSYTSSVGSFERVRYTGDRVQLPIGFHLHENGVSIRFSDDLDREFCQRADEHFAQAWNYRYSSAYGSPEYSSMHRGVRGHDHLRIASAHVLDDGRTLFLEIPDLQLCSQLHLQVATAPDRRRDLFATCNALDAPRADVAGVPSQRKQLARHPLDADMLMATKRIPNPWATSLPSARALRIEAGKNLTFSTRLLRARAGEPLALTLVNPDVVPHNWALVKPGKLQTVGEAANRLVGDPEAVIRQYVPQTSDVICYTDIVEPQEQATIYFAAPSQPGHYPFLCSFPGHWMVMNGELIVEPSK